MTKILFVGASVLVLLVGGFFLLNNYIYQEKQAEVVEGDTVEFEGEVLAVDTEQAMVDGPVIITMKSIDGTLATIAVPSMGLPLCAAFDNIADVYALQSGDTISVKGEVDPAGRIVPCESEEHYLRAGEGQGYSEYIDEEIGLTFEYRQHPNGYILQQPADASTHPDFLKAFVLISKKDFEELQQSDDAREGPPTINIAVFQNSQNQQSGMWADNNTQESNIQLKRGDIADTVVGGANAIRYTVDGLYLADTVVVASSGYVFVLSGSYLEENSQIHQDFKHLVNTIQLDRAPE